MTRIGKLKDYWVLTKPEVNFLVLVSTLVGFDWAAPHPFPGALLVHTLVGTLLVASGTATLNQYLERGADARMRRTAQRPIPAGRIAPGDALCFGLLLAAAGGWYLERMVNGLASLLALLTLGSYLLLYTPLKKRTPLCTLVGAFPGAMPPLIGWAAARGSLAWPAWVLYAIVFLWQFPHFLAIAWMYREDYARAGLRMLPGGDPASRDRTAARQIVGCSLALVPVSLIPAVAGQAGVVYFAGALVLGLGFLVCAARLAAVRSNALARQLLSASVVYLPLLFGLMIVDKS